jgi:membrane protein YqaA with SNARE-associated domain
MLRNLYNRVMVLASSPNAAWWLAVIAFAEASFFPIPPDALLVPMALAKPRRAWRYAAICTVASVVGGALGYLIGFAVFDQVAQPILRVYGYGAAYSAFQAKFQEYGLWIILIKGLTPIPYKIVTIAAGAARFDFAWFMLASLLTRGAVDAGYQRFCGRGRGRVFGVEVSLALRRPHTARRNADSPGRYLRERPGVSPIEPAGGRCEAIDARNGGIRV